MIQNIYNIASSKIIVNGTITDKIKIERGIRQGCPLSVILYAISCDPIARRIQQDKAIRGYHIGKIELKVQQYMQMI